MEPSLFYNEHFHQLIDWQDLSKLVGNYFLLENSFDSLIKKDSQGVSRDAVLAAYDRTDWYLGLAPETSLDIYQVLERLRVHYKTEILGYLDKGRVLDLDGLRHCFTIFSSLRSLHRTIGPTTPIPSDELAPFIDDLYKGFLKKIESYLTESGWDFSAHPQMGPILTKLASTERRLRTETQALMKHELYADALQFDTHDVINGRFVIPIQSDHFKGEMGNIIAHSSSGRTLFVEPFQIMKLATERLELESLLEALQYKFSSEVCAWFIGKSREIALTQSYLTSIDQTQARANFARDHALVRPKFISSGVHIEGFFHPLITKPIRNDLNLPDNYQSLIISGPNTGGKTVLLKSLAISFYFSHLGLFIPARRASFPFYKKIFFFSNDHQNLMQGLSSFASEAGQYLNIVDEIDDDTCVFIDEIFNSTGSEEASALAMGFFKRFFTFSKRCLIFVSTHHQLLKTLTHNKPPYLSGHMGFDTETNAPTYRLYTGLPGSSMAFEIFQGLKNDIYKEDILEEAKIILGQKKVTYEGLLTELSGKKAQIDSELHQVSSLRSELKNQKQASEGVLYLERQKALDEYRRKIDSKMRELDQVIAEARRAEPKDLKKLSKAADEIAHDITPKQSPFNPRAKFESNPRAPSIIEVGGKYRSLLFNCNVEVLAINERKKEAQVNIKGKNIWTSLTSLSSLSKGEIAPRKVSVHVNRTGRTSLEVDGRGQRLEEFEREVLGALEALGAGDIPYLTVIHGHGEGVLKRWLRGYLSKQTDFHWEPTDGNDGSTLIKPS